MDVLLERLPKVRKRSNNKVVPFDEYVFVNADERVEVAVNGYRVMFLWSDAIQDGVEDDLAIFIHQVKVQANEVDHPPFLHELIAGFTKLLN